MGAEVLGLIAVGCVAAGVVGLGIVGVAYRRRDVPAATQFALMMGIVAVWCFLAAGQNVAMWAYANGWSGPLADPFATWAFERVVRVTANQVAPAAAMFVLAYAGYGEWLTRRRLAVLWTVPVVYILFSLVAPIYGHANPPESVAVVTANGITAPTVPTGLATALQTTYGYSVLAVGIVVLSRLLLRTRNVDRTQILAIGLASVFPAVTNLAYNAGVYVHPGTDLTPTTFVLSGLVLGWALYQHDFVSATPLASDVLVDDLPDPVLVLDADDRIIDHNPAAAALAGKEPVGIPVAEVAPGLLERVRSGGLYTPPTDQTRGEDARFYDPRERVITDQHDRERRRLLVLRDVTGQQRRQARLEALQSATQQFIAATTDAEIATLAVDFAEQALDRQAATVLLADAAGERLQPVAVSAYVERHCDPEELGAEPGSPLFDAFREGTRRTLEVECDAGTDRCTVYPLGDHGLFVIGTSEDGDAADEDDQFTTILARTTQVALTQVERERELRRSRASIERRNEQIEFFNGVLRHTLRNALLVIQGRADHLRARVDPDDQGHLDRIEQWCTDLAELTEKIREVHETVRASETKRLDVVDVSAILRERTDAVAAEFDDAAVSLEVPDGLHVLANDLAADVVESVVRNAIRHNDRPEPRVTVTVLEASDRLQIRVADDGPGMSDEIKETVFERDVSTRQTSNGFGLYFVSVMMNLYGGAVWFEDNDPRGTIAVLEFQRADVDDGPDETAASPDGEAGTS